jgi:asparagine N-glycosylation enzyme membrane subunit Stt3
VIIKKCSVDKHGPIIEEYSVQAKIHPDISGTHCWILSAKSYCSFSKYKKIFWEKAKGIRPKNLFLCHKCDNINGFCVNPDHLFLGTAKDNSQDASKKKRMHGSYSEDVKDKKRGKKLSEETKQKISKKVNKFYNENIDAKINTSRATQLSMYDDFGNVKRKYKNSLGIQNICLKNNKYQVSATKNLNNENESTSLLNTLKCFDNDLKFKPPKKIFQVSVYKNFFNLNEAITYKETLLPIIHKTL